MICSDTNKIFIQQGATWSYAGTITSFPTPGNPLGTPLNLNGFSFQGGIKQTPTSTLYPFTFTILDQTTNTGQFTVSMSAAITQTIVVLPFDAPERPISEYLGDMEVTDTSGNVYRFFEFIAIVSPAVDPTP